MPSGEWWSPVPWNLLTTLLNEIEGEYLQCVNESKQDWKRLWYVHLQDLIRNRREIIEKWQRNDREMAEKWLRNDWEMTEKWLRNDWEMTEKWQRKYREIIEIW
jgi:hypothetical protein